jgi:hypothetical protein
MHSFEKILKAAQNSPPSPEQLKEWAERDAENAKWNSYDHTHPQSTPRSALTGWTGRTLNPDDVQYASAYAEKGYKDPEAGILFANWNDVSRRVQDILARAGYELEWEDEWYTCSGCGKAFRTSPDSYGWQPSYADLSEHGELLCFDCVDPEEYLESLEDNPRRALNLPEIDPANHGYVRLNENEFENGWYGIEDDPQAIYKKVTQAGHKRILFQISGVGQFSINFNVWKKQEDKDEDV